MCNTGLILIGAGEPGMPVPLAALSRYRRAQAARSTDGCGLHRRARLLHVGCASHRDLQSAISWTDVTARALNNFWAKFGNF